MISKNAILKPLSSSLYEKSTWEIASLIYDYVVEKRDNIKYISHGLLKNRIGKNYSDEEIMLAARAVAALKTPLLEEKFEFVTENYRETISRRILNLALKNGVFIHPNTGEEITNFNELIHVYYIPHKSFLDSLNEETNERN